MWLRVRCFSTGKVGKYAFSLIKTLHEPRSTEYRLTMHFADEDSAVSVQAFFMEIGMPGFREAAVKGQLKRELQGIPEADLQAAWSRDPYDPSCSKGLLMNESEKSKYDLRFPLHPLTEARKFAASLIAKN